MPQKHLLMAIIMGFVAIYVGAQLVPELWYTVVAETKYANTCLNGTGARTEKCSYNGTTKTFMEMVPWMAAIGLVVSSIVIFIQKRR